MPTLEERLAELERARIILSADLQRIDEQMRVLQQQLAEQRRRHAEQEQSINGKLDGLVQVLTQHANAVLARFDDQESRISNLEQQNVQMAADIKEANRNAAEAGRNATITLGLAQAHQADIHALKESLESVKEDITDLDIKFDRLDKRLDQQGKDITDLNGKVDRLDQEHGQMLRQILDRLPPAS